MTESATFEPCTKVLDVNLLDRAPAHSQVTGNILDGHARQKTQYIPPKSSGPVPLRIADEKRFKLKRPTGTAFQSVKVDLEKHLFPPDGKRSKSTAYATLENNIPGSAVNAAPLARILLDVKDHRTADELGPKMTIVTNSKPVVQYARGHRIPPVQIAVCQEVS
jgi:hypothetical protein